MWLLDDFLYMTDALKVKKNYYLVRKISTLTTYNKYCQLFLSTSQTYQLNKEQ